MDYQIYAQCTISTGNKNVGVSAIKKEENSKYAKINFFSNQIFARSLEAAASLAPTSIECCILQDTDYIQRFKK